LPTYTYTCTSCNDIIEKRQSFHDAALTTCEQCGGSLRKVFHPVGIVFKGSGWYVTDSRSSSSSTVNGSTPESKPKDDTAKSTETSKPAETATTSSTTTTTSKDSKD
jgi:putative FmdB family regulatory protein